MADFPKIVKLLKQLESVPLPVIDLGLDRMRVFMEALGNPQKQLPPVIHVAGTNGKGSTIAYLRAIYESLGLRVHVYTSPHLVRFNERIVLAGEEVSDEALASALERVAELVNDIPVTAFESTTAAAFLLMAEVPADLVILEVGLGGRLDATNLINNPIATVITSISYDHCEFLGESIVQIASEKAGIIKQNAPCILAKQQFAEVLPTIETMANKLSAKLVGYGRDFEMTGDVFGNAETSLHRLSLGLAGRHQFDNAATAIACAWELQDNLGWNAEKVKMALSKVRWPARLQRITTGRLPILLKDHAELWCDGGHNPAAGEVIADWLRQDHDIENYLIVGMVKGKDIQGFLAPVRPHIKRLFSVGIPNEPRSYSANEISEYADGLNITNTAAASIESALQAIAQESTENMGNKRVLICGSLSLMGKVLENNS